MAPMRVLEVARSVVDEINAIAATSDAVGRDVQLRRSAQSIAANIREAFGRQRGAERNQFLRFARGSAEETDEHLRVHLVQGEISETVYWRLHNRGVVCIRMLNALMQFKGTSRTKASFENGS